MKYSIKKLNSKLSKSSGDWYKLGGNLAKSQKLTRDFFISSRLRFGKKEDSVFKFVPIRRTSEFSAGLQFICPLQQVQNGQGGVISHDRHVSTRQPLMLKHSSPTQLKSTTFSFVIGQLLLYSNEYCVSA